MFFMFACNNVAKEEDCHENIRIFKVLSPLSAFSILQKRYLKRELVISNDSVDSGEDS